MCLFPVVQKTMDQFYIFIGDTVTAVLKATADPNELKIQVVDVDGKMLDQFSIKK